MLLAHRAARFLVRTGGCPRQVLWGLQRAVSCVADAGEPVLAGQGVFALREATLGRYAALIRQAIRPSLDASARELLTAAVVLGAFAPRSRDAFAVAVRTIAMTREGEAALVEARRALKSAGLSLTARIQVPLAA